MTHPLIETGRKRGRPKKGREADGGPLHASKIPLNTLDDVRRETARIYREARARTLDVSEASRLSFMLQGLSKMVEATTLERRLTALENAVGLPSIGLATDDDVIDVEVRR